MEGQRQSLGQNIYYMNFNYITWSIWINFEMECWERKEKVTEVVSYCGETNSKEEGSMKWDAILNKMKLVERIITIMIMMIDWLVLLFFWIEGDMGLWLSVMRVQGDFGVWCRRLNENVTRGGAYGRTCGGCCVCSEFNVLTLWLKFSVTPTMASTFWKNII